MAATTLPLRLRSLLLLLCQLLLLLHPFFSGATPWITTKSVSRLPGFSGGDLPFSLETGYVGLDDGVRLFYYFIQSERSPEEDPVLLWLTGGPGCSALSGLVYEIGPLAFDFDGYTGGLPTLLYKPAAWTKVSNIIFVDSPAGTGFSYDSTHNRTIPSDTIVIRQLHIFLQTWFDEHPQFLPNPLYIAGDSYSGLIIPSLAMKIAKGIESGDERLVNLKGTIAGNAFTDIKLDFNARLPFLHGMGIIPDELYEAARENCRGEYRSPSNAPCANSLQAVTDCIKDVNDVHVLEPRCPEYLDLTIFHKQLKTLQDHGRKRLMLESAVSSVCRNATYFLSELWTNDKAVRESLGIQKGTVPSWQRCDFHIPYIMEISSTVYDHLSLIMKGYRSMIYSGDHDSKVSFVGTQAWIRHLNLSVTDVWRPWHLDSQVVGFHFILFICLDSRELTPIT
ncbi:serine carboxypeptidase-like 3 isoform X2 [Brachypodium distachyon]|uniref:serine carboxypeptidase-like 3 isoform X2 n=1 Tax=Brachypodium distachyon TaxID=15368 RepID=UPI00053000A6|nr:serine carboxypeptidase-like 3 isoform X2 [Brachypodium distachyon]|eukprot:XP_010234607.1 serine carboxypeptidase-like 3 isoform X2 [Brachypodium distachyon]